MRALLLVATLLLAGCASPEAAPTQTPTPGTTAPPSPTTPAQGTPPPASGPAWSFTGIDGVTYSRDAPPADATVLFFMATWCGSCRSLAPVVGKAHAEYESRGVRFLSVDFDPTESDADLRAWQERYAHPWPHGLDEGRGVQRALDVRTQSTVVVLDGEGKIVRSFPYGRATESGLREAIDAALAA